MSSHIDRALVLMDLRPDKAVKELKQALAEDPDSSFAHALLASCYLQLEDGDNAMREVKEALRLAADEPFNFYVLARCHFDANRILEAEVAIEEAIELDPFDADYFWFLGLVQMAGEDFEAALQSIERGLEIDPEHANCHNLRSYVLNKLGRKEESDHSADRSLSIDPDKTFTHSMRGWTLLERHQYRDSLPHFREALRLDPDNEWAREGMIKALPSQHWIFQLHLMLKRNKAYLLLVLWLAGNIYLHEIYSHSDSPQGLLVALYASWISFVVFACVLFLPDAIVAGPLLKFLLQFEPDGKHILTSEERRLNNHAVLFLALTILLLLVGIISKIWYPLIAAMVLFLLTRPIALPVEQRTAKCWLAHAGGATLIGVLMFALGAAGENVIYRGLRTFAFINILKVVGGAKLFKVLGVGLGLGLLSQKMRVKKKEEARKKMLEDI